MPIDLAAILIGVLAIIISVIAGMYAASAISREYIAAITARLIAMERKVDIMIEQQRQVSAITPPKQLDAPPVEASFITPDDRS